MNEQAAQQKVVCPYPSCGSSSFTILARPKLWEVYCSSCSAIVAGMDMNEQTKSHILTQELLRLRDLVGKEDAVSIDETLEQASAAPNPRPVVMDWASRMEAVLRRNDHKSGWENMLDSEMVYRIEEEIYEVEDILRNKDASLYSDLDAMEHLLDELADVSNFAAFLNDSIGFRQRIVGQ